MGSSDLSACVGHRGRCQPVRRWRLEWLFLIGWALILDYSLPNERLALRSTDDLSITRLEHISSATWPVYHATRCRGMHAQTKSVQADIHAVSRVTASTPAFFWNATSKWSSLRSSGLRSSTVGYATRCTVYQGRTNKKSIDSSDRPAVSGSAKKT